MGLGFSSDSPIGVEGLYSAFGEPLDHVPLYIGTRCLTTIYGVSYEIEKEFIFDNSLLRVEGQSFPSWSPDEDSNTNITTTNIDGDTTAFREHDIDIGPFNVIEGNPISVVLIPSDGLLNSSLCDNPMDTGMNGYDVEGHARAYLSAHQKLSDKIDFDSEADMFCALSSDKDALMKFVEGFLSYLRCLENAGN